VSCGDTNFYISNENLSFFTLNYLADNFIENVVVLQEKRKFISLWDTPKIIQKYSRI